MELKEKYGSWALITGASSGIGLEFAKYLSARKINLLLAARRIDILNHISEELSSKENIEVIPVQCDLTNDTDVDNLLKVCSTKEIGILINNAGFGMNGKFTDGDSETQRNMIRLNCEAPVILTNVILGQMLKRGKGAVIFLGSILAFQPSPLMALYSATKVFNLFLGESLWWELKKQNIDVLALNPGSTDTEFDRIAGDAKTPGIRKAADVVETAMNVLGKKPSVVDGFRNKFAAAVSKLIPHKLLVNTAGKITTSLYNLRKDVN